MIIIYLVCGLWVVLVWAVEPLLSSYLSSSPITAITNSIRLPCRDQYIPRHTTAGHPPWETADMPKVRM